MPKSAATSNAELAAHATIKAAGWSGAEIVGIVALAAQFQMTNYLNNVAQTKPDFLPVHWSSGGDEPFGFMERFTTCSVSH